jgi:hypothetical protein
MKRILLSVAAVSAVLAATPMAASAGPWEPISQREVNLDRRIDQGVRSGELTRPEAHRLRAELNDLARLEADYRHSNFGLSPAERRDLERRFDQLSAQVYAQKHDGQVRRY